MNKTKLNEVNKKSRKLEKSQVEKRKIKQIATNDESHGSILAQPTEQIKCVICDQNCKIDFNIIERSSSANFGIQIGYIRHKD